MRIDKTAFIILLLVFMSGCVKLGTGLRSDEYSAVDINKRQEVIELEIISVKKAKVVLDDIRKLEVGKLFGSLVGAAIGSAVGNRSDNEGEAIIAGIVAGRDIASNLADRKSVIDGVSIVYRQGNKNFSSAQLGRPCEYKAGKAFIISGDREETRVQPNAVCQ
ncbi:MAG: hypothetical protein ACR2N8_01430 [Parvibaculales bacterium]